MGEFDLRILHVSDLHARGGDEGPGGWRRRRVLGEAWVRQLDEVLGDGPIDLVAFTGDLTWSGTPAEYSALEDFVGALLEKIQTPKKRLFVVPGNHDIDRTLATDAWARLRELGHADELALSEWMAGRGAVRGIPNDCRDLILERQGAYRTWISKLLGRSELLPNTSGHPRLGYRVPVSGFPFPLWMVGLDSAWLAGDDRDQGKLRLTDDQVGILTEGLTGFRIALVHHPLSDLADGAACRRLLADRVDLLLRGHLHETELGLWSDPDRSLRELAAGCLYENDRYQNSCQCITVRLTETGRPLSYEVRLRAWSERGFWHDDGGVYREATGGRWKSGPLVQPSRPPISSGSKSAPGGSLSHQHILGLQAAALALKLDLVALLAGIDATFAAGLPNEGVAGARLLTQLSEMNGVVLTTGEVPLELWLRNAVALAGPRKEASAFSDALVRIGRP